MKICRHFHIRAFFWYCCTLLNLHRSLKWFLNPGFIAKHMPTSVPPRHSTSSEYFVTHPVIITSFQITLAFIFLWSPSRLVLTRSHPRVSLLGYLACFSRSVCGSRSSWCLGSPHVSRRHRRTAGGAEVPPRPAPRLQGPRCPHGGVWGTCGGELGERLPTCKSC